MPIKDDLQTYVKNIDAKKVNEIMNNLKIYQQKMQEFNKLQNNIQNIHRSHR